MSKGESTRRRIVEAAWRVSDSRGAELVLGGASMREVAAEAGLSPSAVGYHFPTMVDLGAAMAEQLAASASELLVEVVDAMLEQVADKGPVAAVRTAAEANWAVVTSSEELEFERRVARCYAATGDGPGTDVVRAALTRLTDSWVADLELLYRRTAAHLGLDTVEPFDLGQVARTVFAMVEGTQLQVLADRDPARHVALTDSVVAFVSAVLVPDAGPIHLDEISLVLTSNVEPGERSELEVDLAAAAALAPLFATGVEPVTMTRAARELGCGPDEVVQRFGSLRRLAAMSFHRHLATIDRATRRRADHSDELAITDGLYELARCVLGDRHCAIALLHERQLAQLGDIADRQLVDIRSVVPLAGPMAPFVREVSGGPGPAGNELTDLLVDTVLGYAATHPRATLDHITSTALRLLPSDA